MEKKTCLKQVEISATIPTGQYANIIPKITIETNNFDEAYSMAMDYIEKVSRDYGEEGKILSKKKEPVVQFDLCPEILSHPNIPKPLHGIAPRTIMGKAWWDKERIKVYESTGYHCAACGVYKDDAMGKKWMEAHEYWDIDYKTGTAKIKKIVPLCHYCHNFIHSGRLSAIIGNEISEQTAKSILEHGFKILSANKLTCFPDTLKLANSIGANTYNVKPYKMPECSVKWSDWKLIFNGKEYHSQFKNIEEWQKHYSNK